MVDSWRFGLQKGVGKTLFAGVFLLAPNQELMKCNYENSSGCIRSYTFDTYDAIILSDKGR